MPVILGPDGPSLGGFVCPAVVAAAERWKLGQLSPGDRVRLVPWSAEAACVADRQRGRLARRGRWIGSNPSPGRRGTRRSSAAVALDDAVLARLEATDTRPEVTYRQAGDRFLLVEYGDMTLDLELRLRVHALDRWVGTELGEGVVDATAGVRSLLVQVDGDRLTVADAVDALRAAQEELDDVADEPFESRIVHLPLSWDDPATREAIERYVHGVRADAPWCPWNIEFIRRINGLDSVDDVHRIVFDASYLVLGLGDVYLGAPVATPLDPRHRLVTTKYNPARTWTAENSVGIGGAYLCIYGMEGPGGYQFVGRTVQVWNPRQLGPALHRAVAAAHLRPAPLVPGRRRGAAGHAGDAVGRAARDRHRDRRRSRLADHRRFLAEHAAEIDDVRARAAGRVRRGARAVGRRGRVRRRREEAA